MSARRYNDSRVAVHLLQDIPSDRIREHQGSAFRGIAVGLGISLAFGSLIWLALMVTP